MKCPYGKPQAVAERVEVETATSQPFFRLVSIKCKWISSLQQAATGDVYYKAGGLRKFPCVLVDTAASQLPTAPTSPQKSHGEEPPSLAL